MNLEMNLEAQLESERGTPSMSVLPEKLSEIQLPAKCPIWSRIYYRVSQFVRGLAAHVEADEMLVAAQVLPKPALARFCQMPVDAQRHSFDVLYSLQDAGYTDPHLAAAALLHDVGKVAANECGAHLHLWLRGPLVLLHALMPDRMRRWATDIPDSGWRYILHVHLTHPQIGATWASQTHCSELTCWLIEHHQDNLTGRPKDYKERLLTVLQWADNRN